MPNLNAYGAYSAVVSPEPLQNMINIEDRREERLQEDRQKAKEREDFAKDKIADLKIGKVQVDDKRMHPLLSGDAQSLSDEFYVKLGDAISKSKTSTDRLLAVDELTQEFGSKLNSLYDESAQLKQLDPEYNPNAPALFKANPELALVSQAIVKSHGDKQKFQNAMVSVPNTLNEYSYFGTKDPNNDPNKPLQLTISPAPQTDWLDAAQKLGKGIKGTKLVVDSKEGDTGFGHYELSDEDTKKLQNNAEAQTHADVGKFNSWMGEIGYYDPSIWIDGKIPINPDGTTNVNAKLDKQKAIEKFNDAFQKEAENNVQNDRVKFGDVNFKDKDNYRLATQEELELFKQQHGIGEYGNTPTKKELMVLQANAKSDEKVAQKILDNKESTVPDGYGSTKPKYSKDELADAQRRKDEAIEKQRDISEQLLKEEGEKSVDNKSSKYSVGSSINVSGKGAMKITGEEGDNYILQDSEGNSYTVSKSKLK